MKVTLENGIVVEGTSDQISNLLTKINSRPDPKKYYISSSRGPVLIVDMDTHHLTNAVLKMYAQWVEDLRYLPPAEIAQHIIDGNMDETFANMVHELSKRDEE